MKGVLVTGATGQIGTEVVSQLRGTDCRIRAMSRNPRAANLPADVEIVRGDLSAPDTLDACLNGIDSVFLVWLAPLAAAAPAIERIAAHAGQIVLLTSPHRTPHPFFQQPNALRVIHAGVEQLIEASPLRWTFLRPGPFAINCRNWWAPQLRNGNVVRWFCADAATAPVHERDIAAVAVRALCDEGHDGREHVLTGPASLTQRQQVQIIGDAVGRPLHFEELSSESAREQMLAMRFPPPVADMLLNAYAAAVGQPALVTSTVLEVTGAPARSFRDWASDHARDFATVTRLLQIVREPLKPGTDQAYDSLEQEQARISATFGCPNPYLGAETLSGPKEVWWFNGYESEEDKQRVFDAYMKNRRLMTTLQRNSRIKAGLTFAPIDRLASYRSDASSGVPWMLGQGRFLVIAVTTREHRLEGTAFEAADGTLFVVRAAATPTEADEARRRMGPAATILAVRPDWSFPDPTWVAADPLFWKK